LRFRLDSKGPFQDSNQENASPPWTLRELEQACLELEKKDAENSPSYSKWLQMLIAPGGSLGGARPKASVTDERKHPWIAKFPSANDEYDIGAWEMVIYRLAVKAGINIAQARLQKFNNRHHTFLSKRFDRTALGERIQFTSAATLLQRSDGDDAAVGASYLELAEFITRFGAEPTHDLETIMA
jgi:serine/threonine-protein kinase HipA